MRFKFEQQDCLLIVDPQIDFMPGGALGVPEGDQIIPVVNELIAEAIKQQIPIIISRDWHPENHCSFKEQGGPWPRHCVQFSKGAEFHPNINVPCDAVIISKGNDPKQEAYSVFAGQTQDGEKLADILKTKNIKRVVVAGLALDYCVYHSAKDAIKNYLDVHVVKEATKAIDANKSNSIIEEIEKPGPRT